jgi:hypothetical protein
MLWYAISNYGVTSVDFLCQIIAYYGIFLDSPYTKPIIFMALEYFGYTSTNFFSFYILSSMFVSFFAKTYFAIILLGFTSKALFAYYIAFEGSILLNSYMKEMHS